MKRFQSTNSLIKIFSPWYRKPLLALFFLFILLTQQFSAYAGFSEFSSSDKFSSIQASQAISHVYPDYFIPIQTENKLIQYEAIVELEEDDSSTGHEEGILNCFSRRSIHEIVIASSVKTQFLNLAHLVNQQAKISLFVLNHSWKNQLI